MQTRPSECLWGEQAGRGKALAESGAEHLIFRTSWVYGARGKNFLLTILKLARERESAARGGGSAWCADVEPRSGEDDCGRVIRQCEAAAAGRDLRRCWLRLEWVYHAAGAGETTWYGFAAEAVRFAAREKPGMRVCRVEAITTAEYPTPARRPANSRMNCDRLRSDLDGG